VASPPVNSANANSVRSVRVLPEGREIISNFSDYGTSIVTGRALGWRRLGQQDMRAETEKDDKTRLLEAASALIAQGHAKFSIAALCEEARVDRDVFRTHFSGRAELMTLLEEASASEPAPAPQIRPPTCTGRRSGTRAHPSRRRVPASSL